MNWNKHCYRESRGQASNFAVSSLYLERTLCGERSAILLSQEERYSI
jgi:hypothetical protein